MKGQPKGRPKGRTNTEPRVKRQLTQIQKLREHILIEIGMDKQDIADALDATRQTVSNVFLDVHRSPELEARIVDLIRTKYEFGAPSAQRMIDVLMAGASISQESLGWPQRVAITPKGKEALAEA